MAAMGGCGIQSSRTWQNEEKLRDDVSLNCACRISPGLIDFDLGLGVMLFNPKDLQDDYGFAVCDSLLS